MTYEDLIQRIMSDMAFEELVPFYEMCELEQEYRERYEAKLRTKTPEELQLIYRDRQNENLTPEDEDRLDKALEELP
jgi:hypothetical protein